MFDWADSYDTKDWKRLETCIAPTMIVSPRLVPSKIYDHSR